MAFLPLRRVPVAEAAAREYDQWLDWLAEELSDPQCDRNELCRQILTDLYYPELRDVDPNTSSTTRTALLRWTPQRDPEPEYYAEIDTE